MGYSPKRLELDFSSYEEAVRPDGARTLVEFDIGYNPHGPFALNARLENASWRF